MADESSSDESDNFFDRERHIRYLEMTYQLLPSAYENQEINRLTMAYFTISGLQILDAHDRSSEDIRSPHLHCQSQYSGFSKFPGQLPDLYHSYYGFSAFSMLQEAGLNPIHVELGITDAAADSVRGDSF